MCSMLKELIVPLSDLQTVVITCSRCKTDITFGLLLEKQNPDAMAKTTATPEMCPVCEVKFDQRAQESVDALREAYKNIVKQKSLTVSFRVRSDVALP
jgi:hypothetical protein